MQRAQNTQVIVSTTRAYDETDRLVLANLSTTFGKPSSVLIRYHMDCCTMMTAWKHAKELRQPATTTTGGYPRTFRHQTLSYQNAVGPGVVRVSEGHPAHGVSWCTSFSAPPARGNLFHDPGNETARVGENLFLGHGNTGS